jgi:hypothetical protein
MSDTKPSGTPLIPDNDAVVVQEVAEIDERGRIKLLPRWADRTVWLKRPDKFEALIVLAEPGRASLRNWEPDGPRIIARYNELKALGKDADIESLRLIQDRYSRLSVPSAVDRRAYLGEAALEHLGLPGLGTSSNVYVVIYPDRLDLLSPALRNDKLRKGHPDLDGLPD